MSNIKTKVMATVIASAVTFGVGIGVAQSVYAADNGVKQTQVEQKLSKEEKQKAKEEQKKAKEAQKKAKEAAKIAKEKAEIDALSEKILTRLYTNKPTAEEVVKKCYGYATLGATGNQLIFTGDSHGRGVAFNNETGDKVYMKMEEYKVGFGLGVKEFDLVFIFGTPESWQDFISGKFKFAAEAEAAATDSVNGASLEGATMVGSDMWVYQTTTKGATLGVSLKGMNIYRNKKLNGEE